MIKNDNTSSHFPDSKIYTVGEIVKDFCDYPFISIQSKRRTGKSVLVRDIVYHLLTEHERNPNYMTFDIIFLFSDTAVEEDNEDYKFINDFMKKHPEKARIYDASQATVNKKINSIKRWIKECKEKKKRQPNIIIIFDDVNIEQNRPPAQLVDLAIKGRHKHILTIVSTQFSSAYLSPQIRGNCDYIFFSILSNSYKEKIYDNLVTSLSKKEFMEWADNNTKNFEFIMYDNYNHKGQTLKLVKAKIYKKLQLHLS